jgi:hypothetical protein
MHSLYIRQSGINCGDTKLKTPENSGVKRPAYDLDLGAPDAIVVFFGAMVETCTLLGRHVAVGKAIEIRANEVCRRDFCSEKELIIVKNLSAPIVYEVEKSLPADGVDINGLTPVNGIR